MIVPERVHLIGIGGTGMSSIATLLLQQGKIVSGSDARKTTVTQRLERLGAIVHQGHRADHVGDAQLVVTSTAIAPDNPELSEAVSRGIPVVHRSEIWAHFLNAGQGVAIAGAHGKTTVTAMISWVLHEAGRDPSFLIGGELPGLGGGRSGGSDIIVAEADESDGSFLRYRPWCAVVTSVEPDHLEHYDGDKNKLLAAYTDFIKNVSHDGLVVLCSDEEAVMDLATDASGSLLTYGVASAADLAAENIVHDGFVTTADVHYHGAFLGTISLQLPGVHNVKNALAAIVVTLSLGLSWDEVTSHLATFPGVGRRFEVVGEHGGVLIIDDYAHHPSEVSATIGAAKRSWPQRRVVAVFQPHRYSRTHFMFDEFKEAFSAADHVVLTDIYAPAAEQPIPGVSGQLLAAAVERHVSDHARVDYVATDTLSQILRELIVPGDIVVAMGAGDISQRIRQFAAELGHAT